MKYLLCLMCCGVMATCSFSRHADGTSSYTGGLEYDLPTGGYAK